MTAAAYAIRNSTPVDQINTALKGSVIDALRLFIPSLAAYTNEQAFNVILNSPEMAQRSFRVFRDHPDAFAELMRTSDNQPVSSDDETLSCGRTLTQVVALVVQAVAKRYFRAKLSLRRVTPIARTEPSLTDKMSRFLFGGPTNDAAPRPKSQGDRLFQAMRDNLLFEWQLKLIPHYVGLPIPVVQALGARLLEFKEIEDIQWMVRTGQPLQVATVRHAETEAPLHIAPDLGPVAAPLDLPDDVPADEPAEAPTEAPAVVLAAAEDQTTVSLAPDPKPTAPPVPHIVPWHLPEGVSTQRYVAAILARVNPPLARTLAQNLGVNPRQLAMMLIRAYETLPASEFRKLGVSAPDSEEARRFITAANIAGFGQNTSAPVVAEFARLYLAKIRSLM